MEISITGIQRATSAQWDQIWSDCDYATYFHSREWAEIWNRYTAERMKPTPLLVRFSDGRQALLPLVEESLFKGLARRTVASPAGTYGGWIANQPLEDSHRALLIKYLLHQTGGSLVWRWNPYAATAEPFLSRYGRADETHTLDLTQGFEVVFRGWSKGHNSAAKKALKAGVTVQVAEGLQDWAGYYAIYEDSLRRWGEKATSSYRWELFKIIFERKSPAIKLWLAKHEGNVLAGALMFYAKQHVVYWHGAALEEHFLLRPVHGLLHEVIRDACEKQYRWFDFNPSGNHEGVRAFKRNFGTMALLSPVIEQISLTERLVRFVRLVKRWA